MFVFNVSNYLPYKYKYILNSSKVKIKLFSVFTYILTFSPILLHNLPPVIRHSF
jgi:hypothetical protein